MGGLFRSKDRSQIFEFFAISHLGFVDLQSTPADCVELSDLQLRNRNTKRATHRLVYRVSGKGEKQQLDIGQCRYHY